MHLNNYHKKTHNRNGLDRIKIKDKRMAWILLFVRRLCMDYLNAFWVGGLICALVQILMEKTKMMPGRIMVLLVCLGAVISVFGIYEPFQE